MLPLLVVVMLQVVVVALQSLGSLFVEALLVEGRVIVLPLAVFALQLAVAAWVALLLAVVIMSWLVVAPLVAMRAVVPVVLFSVVQRRVAVQRLR